MAQLGDTIIKGDLNILGDLHVGGASNIANNNNIKVLYDKEIALTSEMQNIPLNSPSSNYSFLMIALRSGWNYTSTWIIPKIDYGRNNICPVFDNEGNFDLVYSIGITDTTFPVQNKKPLRGVVLLSIWGLFPTASANSNIQGTTDIAGLLNLFYPVGSYYETSDANFDPNVSWGGTWVQDTVGRCTVGANTNEDPGVTKNGLVNLSVNGITGEATHTLSVNEMPTHTHAHRVVKQTWTQIANKDADSGLPRAITGDGNNRGWSEYVSDGNCANQNTGGSQSHNNVQPSIGVVRWHRTA